MNAGEINLGFILNGFYTNVIVKYIFFFLFQLRVLLCYYISVNMAGVAEKTGSNMANSFLSR